MVPASVSDSPSTEVGPLQLLILQATPFCNINCRYCYLPSRSDTRLMSIDTVEAAARAVAEADLLKSRATVVWHAGEPLVAPISFYEQAIEVLGRLAPQPDLIRHTIQTNGTLINDAWCEFFLSHNIRIGISIDGPARIHDSSRVTRSGKGTFASAMRGLDLLQKHSVPCYMLSVLTADSLSAPDELHAFYVENDVSEVGFNVEEIEGVNLRSSLEGKDTADRFRVFVERFYSLVRGNVPRVREFRSLESLVLRSNLDSIRSPQQLTPYKILTVDVEGGFSTFSPELLGMRGGATGDFVLGNVHSDGLRAALESDKFRAIWREIQAGVGMCKSTCEYFPICGGGSPSNKFSENGTFASTETLQCRLRVKVLGEAVLSQLERKTPSVSVT